MSKLPEWANWLARDKEGSLWCFETEPKILPENSDFWIAYSGISSNIYETDDTYVHIKWTDEEPTSVATLSKTETVNHPVHYQGQKYEVIDIIEDYNLGFSLGNVIKYTLRAEHKGNKIEDLKKAIWYLNRELEREET